MEPADDVYAHPASAWQRLGLTSIPRHPQPAASGGRSDTGDLDGRKGRATTNRRFLHPVAPFAKATVVMIGQRVRVGVAPTGTRVIDPLAESSVVQFGALDQLDMVRRTAGIDIGREERHHPLQVGFLPSAIRLASEMTIGRSERTSSQACLV